VLKIGSYKLNIEDMVLSRDGNDVILEPKVLSVLIYFCENKDRYISMSELHENVWKDRCVSDAAVRRIISKIRLLFNDDHKSPKYIQSLPKRGYKLICSVKFIQQEQKEALDSLAIKPQNHSSKLHSQGVKVASKSSNAPFGYIMLLFLGICFLFGSYFVFFEQVDFKTSHEIIATIPGSKIAFGQSSDNQYFAFSGKIGSESGYQVFIKRDKKHDFLAIKHKVHFPFSLAFSRDNKYLFYSDLLENNSSLSVISLESSENIYESIELIDDFYLIGDVFTSNEADKVYFSGQKNQNEPVYIFKYDLISKNILRVTSSTDESYSDIRGGISPNGQFMVVLRTSKYDKNYEIRIIDLINDDVIFRHSQKLQIKEVSWLDDDNLLLLDQDGIYSFNYKKNYRKVITKEIPNITAISLIDSHNLLLMNKLIPKKVYVELQLPMDNWSTHKVFDMPATIQHLTYQADSYLALDVEPTSTELLKFDPFTKNRISFLETQYPIEIIETSNKKQLGLIKFNDRFALINVKTNQLTYITAGDEYIGDAVFSKDGKYVLYSVKGFNGWEILEYNIDLLSKNHLFKGYRSIRNLKNNFILAEESGELYLYDVETKNITNLNYQISPEPNTSWNTHKNSIYWSSHDLVNTIFHQIDLSDLNNIEEYNKSYDYDKVSPVFVINDEKSKLLISQKEMKNSQVLQLSIL
jgi:DNA-binding winged helix-turn-helix (wHTH) protein